MSYYHNFYGYPTKDFESKYGGFNPLDDFAFPGYRTAIPGGVQTANQLAELGNTLNQGVTNVELGPISADILEQIPRQHFGEAYRLAKLTGANLSMHGPIIDLGGFGEQGFNESQRIQTETRLKSILERAHDFDPKGNVPVVFHTTTGTPAFELRKGHTIHDLSDKERKNLLFPEEAFMGVAINQQTGQLVPLQYEEKSRFGTDKKDIFHPTNRLRSLNNTEWDQEKLKVQSSLEEIRRLSDREQTIRAEIYPLVYAKEKRVINSEEQARLTERERDLHMIQEHIDNINDIVKSQLSEMWTKVDKYGFESQKEKQNKLKDPLLYYGEASEAHNRFEEARKKVENYHSQIINNGKKLSDQEVKGLMELEKGMKEKQDEYYKFVTAAVGAFPTPQMYKPVDDFAKEKVSETVSNAMVYAYNQFKEKAPLIALENYMPELTLSRADSLKGVVEESRKKFEKKLMENNKKINEKEAKRISEKLIGATWDTGHINFLRKSGYSQEDVLKEAEKIAKSKLVKHVHINDTFGFTDSHLPPGMGNAGINEQLALLEKWKKDDFRAVVEAGAFVAQFKSSPHLFGMEQMNTPVYAPLLPSGERRGFVPGDMTWRGHTDVYDPYMAGFGNILPEVHFREMYGAGFSSLPVELGGQTTGDRSRFAGTPNQ